MDFLMVNGVSRLENGRESLQSISFIQKKGQKIAIAGETGSGKSTLLKIIGGYTQAQNGEVRFLGRKVKGPDEKLIPGHPGIAYLSQQYELPNNMWVSEVLEYADELPPGDAGLLYRTCRIDHLIKRRTNQLSGGEKQRIALARLLTGLPGLLLLDEPFSNLDPIHKRILKDVIQDIADKLGTTCMLASHDPLDTLSWADEIIVIRDGRIVQQDAPAVIYRKPVNAYVAGLFGAFNLVPSSFLADAGVKSTIAPDKTLFFRPEDILIAEKGGKTISVTIDRVSFMGNHYELALRAGKVQLLAHTMTGGNQPGQQLEIGLRKDAAWSFPGV